MQCSGMSPCSSCTKLSQKCIFDKTLDQRRRVAAKRTVDELNYYRNLFDDLLKAMRAEDQLVGLRVLDFIRHDTAPDEIRKYLDDLIRLSGKKGEEG